MPSYFILQNEITHHYRLFKAEGRELILRLTAPPPSNTAARYFAEIVDTLFEYTLSDLQPSDMVGISVHDADNQHDSMHIGP